MKEILLIPFKKWVEKVSLVKVFDENEVLELIGPKQ